MNGGQPGNPFGNFNPITTTTQFNNSNFDNAYTPNEPIIEKITYKNNGQFLHNNLNENILDENIVEYRLYIDSLDRDINIYPNPFNFTVKFNAGQTAPGPMINKDFRNVKYIKLETVVLPQHSRYIQDKKGRYTPDPDSYLPDDRFVVLCIKELEECNQVYTTLENSGRIDPHTGDINHPPKPFGLIFPDTKLGRIYYTGTPYTAQRAYKNSTLGNIGRLTLQLYDSCGNILGYDHFEKDVNDLPHSDICHPLHKHIQVHYTFVIGMIEPHINTVTKFEN
jgi:hypothetical protein